ncbi:BsaWI family type II restriction enzyme [Desulfurobacterium crinifex]
MENERIERQREVSEAGKQKEDEVIELLLNDEFIRENFLIDRPSKLSSDFLNKEDLKIPYNNQKELIDADICIVRKSDRRLVCVISVKKSFRERGGQTAYWAVKVKQHNKDFKYILVTPDVDQELYNPEKPEKRRKWRIILPFECDAVFVYSFDGKVYEEEKFFVGKNYLLDFIKKLAN